MIVRSTQNQIFSVEKLRGSISPQKGARSLMDLPLLWLILLLSILPDFGKLAYSSTGRTISYIIVVSAVVFAGLIWINNYPSKLFWLGIRRAKPLLLMIFSMLMVHVIQVILKISDVQSLIGTLGISISALFAFCIIPVIIAQKLLINWWKVITIIPFIIVSLSLGAILSGNTNIAGVPLTMREGVLSPLGLPVVMSIFSHNLSFGIFCLQGTIGSLFFINSPKIKSRLFGIFALGVSLTGILLSWSRSALIGFLIAICAWTFFMMKSRWLFILAVCLPIIFIIFAYIPKLSTLPRLLSLVLDIQRGGGGREYVYPAALSAIMKNPWIGYGPDGVYQAIVNEGGEKVAYYLGLIGTGAHNTFLDISLGYGLLSASFFILTLAAVFIRVFRANLTLSNKSILIAAILSMISQTFAVSYSIGGVRYMSLVLTIIFGLANASPWLFANQTK